MHKTRSDIEISKSGNKSTCTISLEGDLTLNSVTDIKKKITAALENCDSVQLIIQEVTSIDLSWMQLLYSLKKTCKRSGRDISTAITLPSETELLFLRTGFNSLLDSTKSKNQTTP